jgi:hypothetical protein
VARRSSELSCFGLTAELMTKILISLIKETEFSVDDSHGFLGRVLRIGCLLGDGALTLGPNINRVWRAFNIVTEFSGSGC